MKNYLIGLILVISGGIAAEQGFSQALVKTPPVLKLTDPLPANLFVELGKAINPAVVNISTSVIPHGRQYNDPMMEMLEQFYGNQYRAPKGQPGRPQRMGLGTGFIIREDGLIVTNAHVIQGADLIEVQLTENAEKQYKATVIGSDQRTDIALIKIEPKEKLTAAALGSSKETQVGEWVAAFGNPYGHGHTMTKGIISSTGRAIEEINKFPLLQTDASINPGNSGGPLVNSRGLVIGVNSAIDARAQGIGFAIPIDEVKAIIPQLETHGSIRKGYLGITPGDIQSDEEYRGSVVLGLGDGPGKKAGLKIYDLITEVNGKKIKHAQDLVYTVADIEPGKKVKVKVLRNDRPVTLDVTIGERPDERPKGLMKSITKKLATHKAPFNLGFSVADLNDELRSEFLVDTEVQKPIVVEMDANSIAGQQGLRTGDLIVEVNRVDITNAKDVLKNLKKGQNRLKVARPDGVLNLELNIR